jgi:actin-related protein
VIQNGKLIKESVFQQTLTMDYALQLKSHHKNGLINLEMESNTIFDYERKLMEFCFVSENVEKESTDKYPLFYEIPETFFNKKFCENEFTIQELILKSVDSCKENIQSELLEHILMEGSITNIRGFLERLEIELKNLRPKEKISIEKETKFSPISFVQDYKNQNKFITLNIRNKALM